MQDDVSLCIWEGNLPPANQSICHASKLPNCNFNFDQAWNMHTLWKRKFKLQLTLSPSYYPLPPSTGERDRERKPRSSQQLPWRVFFHIKTGSRILLFIFFDKTHSIPRDHIQILKLVVETHSSLDSKGDLPIHTSVFDPSPPVFYCVC